ncbi:hypothetical protein TNCV_2994431 [Trichonephila clavipes]|nr:hypothetical protein TNCV_2994431 [Trichonephila clavipes]
MDLDVSKGFCSEESGWRTSLPIGCSEVRIMAQEMTAQVEGGVGGVVTDVQLENSPRFFGSSSMGHMCVHYSAITDDKSYTDFISKDVDATAKGSVRTLVNDT